VSEKRIVSIGCEIPGGFSEYFSIDSDQSLLDWDIILFNPTIHSFVQHTIETYQGKPSLHESSSFQLRERIEHWKREIRDAAQIGKTVIIFLPELSEVYIDTGERRYSGTGRNRQTTTIVAGCNNYQCLPFELEPISSKGTAMRLAKGSEVLSSYWSEFSEWSSYKVRIEGKVSKPLIVTTTGDKTVGAMIKMEDSTGTLLLLPYLNLDAEEFYKETKDGECEWNKKGQQFGHRLLTAIIEIDRSLRQSRAVTPTPEWAQAAEFILPKELKLRQEVLKIDEKIEILQKHRLKTKALLTNESNLRSLLFEKGSPLEDSILQALRLMGFSANNYKDSESEFDAVFESPEGRFLGEVEGKDKSAIGIDKLRQLEMNIHEDLARDEVTQPAQGVLFGNAHLLLPLSERPDFFTEKCVTAVKRSGTILVRSTDLFKVAQYLSGNTDHDYAQKCRKAMMETSGEIIQFPDPPTADTSVEED
jgi:hypothetical protein